MSKFRKIIGRKTFLSVLATCMVGLTSVATTYAWVGVLSNSTFEQFGVNIRGSELLEYGIEVSTTGTEGTFKDSLSFDDVKKSILLNWGYDESSLKDQNEINNIFSFLKMDQCTPQFTYENGKITSFGSFTDLYLNETKKLYKFDLYVSVKKTYDIVDDSEFMLDVYLGSGLMTGNTKKYTLFNKYTYPDTFVNPLLDNVTANIAPYVAGDEVKVTYVDSSTSARIAFEKYKVVEKNHPELYDNTTANEVVIYQNGGNYPYKDLKTGVSTYGGILKDEDNLATYNYNGYEHDFWTSKGNVKSVSLPDIIWQARGAESSSTDKVLTKETNHLIDSSNPNEQISVGKMMKVTCYFWFEGWDADCFPAINLSPVNISINMNMSNDEEF